MIEEARPTRALLTGFEPFTTGQGLALTHNPTAGMVERVAARMNGVDAAVLPVSYAATRARLTALFDALQPRIWIGLGYAPHRTTLDVETIAVNMEHAVGSDNDGERPWMRPIIAGAPVAYESTLDMAMAVDALGAAGVEAKPCFHAGTFLCNQVFYLGCHRAHTHEHLSTAAFIHVPPMKKSDAFERGLAALVGRLVASV